MNNGDFLKNEDGELIFIQNETIDGIVNEEIINEDILNEDEIGDEIEEDIINEKDNLKSKEEIIDNAEISKNNQLENELNDNYKINIKDRISSGVKIVRKAMFFMSIVLIIVALILIIGSQLGKEGKVIDTAIDNSINNNNNNNINNNANISINKKTNSDEIVNNIYIMLSEANKAQAKKIEDYLDNMANKISTVNTIKSSKKQKEDAYIYMIENKGEISEEILLELEDIILREIALNEKLIKLFDGTVTKDKVNSIYNEQ